MKICFLTDDPNKVGGGPEHVLQVSRTLHQKYGYSVGIITPRSMDENFSFHNFFQRVKFAFWILRFMLTTDYDIYHSHTFSTAAFSPLVKLRGKRTGVTIHGAGRKLLGGGILNRTFIPNFLRWLILEIWPFDIKFSASTLPGFKTIGNGVIVQPFSKIKWVPHKRFTMLCISRNDPVKGLDVLRRAVSLVPNVELNLVTGRRRTIRDFQKADIYVLPSLSEGLPIVLLEAMAAKLPIITTDVGDCRRIIEKASCGIVVSPGSVEELVAAIKKMIRNKNRAKMGERGFAYVSKNYSWAKVAASYHSAYSRLNP